MSSRKIIAAFKRKNIVPYHVEYMRCCPVPEGYASGWDIILIVLIDATVAALFDKGFTDCECYNERDHIEEVLEWIESMPVIMSL